MILSEAAIGLTYGKTSVWQDRVKQWMQVWRVARKSEVLWRCCIFKARSGVWQGRWLNDAVWGRSGMLLDKVRHY